MLGTALGGEPLEDRHRLLQMPLRQAVGEGVVVDMLVELVGADDAGQLEPRPRGIPFQPARPVAGGLVEDLGAVVAQELPVTGRGNVAEDAIGHAGGDMDLLLPGPDPVLPVRRPFRRRLPAGIGGFPGVLRAPEAVLARVLQRARQGMVAIGEQRPRRLGLGEDEEGQQEDLGIPEDMPLVALARERLGADIGAGVLLVRGDQQVIDAEPRREARLRIAGDHAVAGVPFRAPRGGALLETGGHAAPSRRIEAVEHVPADVPGRHVARGGDGGEFLEDMRHAPACLDPGDLRHALVVARTAQEARALRQREDRAGADRDAGIERSNLDIGPFRVNRGRLYRQMPAPGPFLPDDLGVEHRLLAPGRQPVEIVALGVERALHREARGMVLRRDAQPDAAEMAIGQRGEAQAGHPRFAPLPVAEQGVAMQESGLQVEDAPVLEHLAGLHVEDMALDAHAQRNPAGHIDLVDHCGIVMVVDAV